MASSMLTAEKTASASTEADADEALNTAKHSCANDPDFAVICDFLQKFSKDLGLELPNFRQLLDWFTKTNEVPPKLRDMQIKLLRKTRKTVHEKSWESSLSKFCFTHSAQDAWEIERFGYKNCSVKIKLRVLRELLECQFERNSKFRAKILTLSADSLRSQPIGRDRLGHAYWVTQDNDCNLRIYQEHLDEEIWQVVATNRDEFANLIKRLKGSEVVLPSSDIGIVDEDTSSSSSSSQTCSESLPKPPPPEEHDDSQEDEQKVPKLSIKLLNEKKSKDDTTKDVGKGEEELAAEEDAKLVKKIEKPSDSSESDEGEFEEVEEEYDTESDEDGSEDEDDEDDEMQKKDEKTNTTTETKFLDDSKKVKPLLISQNKIVNIATPSTISTKKRTFDQADTSSPTKTDNQQMDSLKKSRPSLLDSKRLKPVGKYEDNKHRGEEEYEETAAEDDDIEEEVEEEDIDSVAAEEDENEEKQIEDFDDDEDDDDNEVGEEIADPVVRVVGEGSGKECNTGNSWFNFEYELDDGSNGNIVGDIIQEDIIYVHGEGYGSECLVGNNKKESDTSTTITKTPADTALDKPLISKIPETKPNNDSEKSECPKLSPLKDVQKVDFEKSKLAEIEERDKDSHSDTSASVKQSLKESETKEIKKAEVSPINGENNHKNEKILASTSSSDTQQSASSSMVNKTKVPDSENLKEIQEIPTEPENLSISKPNLENLIVAKQESKISDTNKQIHATKMSVLESLKKELRESKQKSMEKSAISIAEANKSKQPNPTILNRKRRLDDLTAQQALSIRPSNSESEIELNPENPEELPNEHTPDDIDEQDVGGKRPKIRPKQTNSELRKKVEAKKEAAKEENTSSSGGEEDSRRRRKIILPKKHADQNLLKSEETDSTKKNTNGEKQEGLALQVAGKTPAPAQKLPIRSTTCKNKPTLDEIIEKKLKKTPEKNNEKSVSVPVNEKTDVDTATKCILPPQIKSPITKPLKKTLLSQIRQEQNEEEAVPRKRTNSEDLIPPVVSDLKSSIKIEASVEATLTNDIESQKNTVERQRKRRSSEETVDNDKPEEPEAKKEVTCVNLKETESEKDANKSSANEDIEVEIKTNIVTKDSKVEPTTPIAGRRSGRRGGLSSSGFVESPQAKRTRGCVKNSTKKDKCDIKVDKTDSKEEDIISNKSKDPEKTEDQKNSSDKHTLKEDKPTELSKNQTPKAQASTKSPIKGTRKQKDVDTTNIIQLADNETPVRQSRRIAQQKIREEAERRKLEEIALRTMKKELKKKKKAEKEADPTVMPPSESSSESEESDEETKRKVQKKKCPGKNGSWSSGSEEQDEPDEVDEEPHRYETDPGSPLFKSDHEFSPESEIEDESQVVPMKRARTLRKEDAADDELAKEEEACQKCNKSDHPEWILLCDNCDKGYHCSCLSPVLFYIPEGDWYCPPCQQDQLIKALENQLKEFDDLVENKKKEEEKEKQKLADEEKARQDEETRKSDKNKNSKNKTKRKNDDSSGEGSSHSGRENEEDETGRSSDESENKTSAKNKNANRSKNSKKSDKRNHRNRRQNVRNSRNRVQKSDSDSDSDSQRKSKRATKGNYSSSSSSSSSSYSESDNEPIYKLRKRRQINVSYRLNEYDEIINSALKKEMDEAAGAGNLGRGKDISTIIEADKEEKARQQQLGDEEPPKEEITKPKEEQENGKPLEEHSAVKVKNVEVSKEQKETVGEDSDDEPITQKFNIKPSLKKKARKLTTLDISSGDDDGSDEDFKGSSLDDEDEDTSISASNSDSSLEIYKRHGKSKKKRRKAARKASRRRRKDRKFIVDESDDEEVQRPKSKKKRKDDSDYTESDAEDDLSELSENIDSADLCDDTTTDESDGAWRPNNRKKAKKSTIPFVQKSPKPKKPETKKPKKVEYSDDDISESEEEDDDENDDGVGSGKGMGGKQPRSQPLKSTATKTKGKGKGKGGATSTKTKKKKKSSEDEESVSADSADSTRRTRGRRYAYMEDFDDDSSDGGIKPGVQRPDTPPEEREKFIKRQEEIKRMLAEKNAEGAKLAATPRLTPIKTDSEKDKRSPVKAGGDSLSTVPLSVIRQAKVLDIDYLHRRGESLDDLGNEVGDVDDDFDDVDLPNDLPEDMDEDTIARMVEEEEEFGAAAARELPAPDEVLRAPTSVKPKIKDVIEKPPTLTTSVAPFPAHAPPQIPVTLPSSGLQEPVRKRLPMPTMHPPLLRHQFFMQDQMASAQHLMQRHSGPPTSHFLQSALSAPLTQPIERNYPPSLPHPSHHSLINRMTTHNIPLQPTVSHALSATRPPFSNSTKSSELIDNLNQEKTANIRPEGETKPRGRRKKITPLRDPLQKQQAAAAVTAATATNSVLASASAKTKETCSTSLPSSVIKAGPPMKVQMQTNVITSMPPSTQSISSRPSLGGIYARPDGPRFYDPHMNRPGVHRQRGPPQMPPSLLPPHPAIRSSYGPPPPLKGSSSSATSNAPGGSIRTPMHHLPTYVGMPPNARHSAPHLNMYRPSMYGNPNFGPRVNLRHPNMHAPEYSTGSRAPYAPYGFYPPPPPLTAPGHGPPSAQMHQAKAATTTSVIVSATAAAPSTSAATSSGRPPNPPPALSEPSSKSGNQSQALQLKASPSKSASPSRLPQDNKIMAEPRKKLTTLQAYSTESNTKKSPQATERPESHSSSPRHQAEAVEDLSSTPATPDNAPTADQSRPASEFSGLVSYFSSQHDDYNT